MMLSEVSKYRSVTSGDQKRFDGGNGIVKEFLLLQFDFIDYFNQILSACHLRIK